MPNWCANRLSIRAKGETLDEIRSAVAAKVYGRPTIFNNTNEKPPLQEHHISFSLHAIIPQPDEMLDEEDPRRTNKPKTSDELLDSLATKPGVMPDWWQWRVNNWGTKWELNDVSVERKKNSLLYIFDTAWAPPVPVIERLSEMFPDATIVLSFYEPGCIGRGSVTFRGGVITKETGVGV